MQPEAETPVQGENEQLGAQGTTEQPATDSQRTVEPESKTDVQPVDSVDNTKTETQQTPAELEKLRKELDQIKMERNMLRKKQEEAELKNLEEAENYKELADRYKSQLEEQEAAREQEAQLAEARKFRNDVINSYPDEATRKAAQALIAKNEANLTWGDVDSFDDAKTQLVEQLDAIKEVVSPEQTPQVDANNPLPPKQQELDRKELVSEAARKRDFGEVLRTIPSVQEQIQRMKDGI